MYRAQLLLTTSWAAATRRFLIMSSPLKGMNTNNILFNNALKLNYLIMNTIMKPPTYCTSGKPFNLQNSL